MPKLFLIRYLKITGQCNPSNMFTALRDLFWSASFHKNATQWPHNILVTSNFAETSFLEHIHEIADASATNSSTITVRPFPV